MPDVLTHVLVGYVVGTLLTAVREDVGPAEVTLVMVGALSPDFVKIELLVPAASVEAALGVPFSWEPLHTAVGGVVVALLSGLVVGAERRRRTVALVAVGAATHLFLDALLFDPTGYAFRPLSPLSTYRPPAGMLYLSSDRWPAAVAATAAAATWAWRRYRRRVTPSAADRR
ncbi:metal-dependent hydrolase [Halobacteriales archaeon QS_4_69_225]|nr:MAG: metal-dependent hydrolase [Halobacteriales archaeon QS_4_69_225]